MPSYFCSPSRNNIGGRFAYCPLCEAHYDPISSLPHKCYSPPLITEERVKEIVREILSEKKEK